MKNGIKLVVLALADVLTRGNQFRRAGEELGIMSLEEAKIMAKFCVHSSSYTVSEWVKMQEQVWRGSGKATKEAMEKALSNYELMPGARELVDYLKKEGYEIVILSGQNDFLAKTVAEDLGINPDHARARCFFTYSMNNQLREIVVKEPGNSDTATYKFFELKNFASWFGIQTNECACVGALSVFTQGVLFEKTGHGIALESAPEELKKMAWKVVPDLIGLKEIL